MLKTIGLVSCWRSRSIKPPFGSCTSESHSPRRSAVEAKSGRLRCSARSRSVGMMYPVVSRYGAQPPLANSYPFEEAHPLPCSIDRVMNATAASR